jgi:hypothetical protein
MNQRLVNFAMVVDETAAAAAKKSFFMCDPSSFLRFLKYPSTFAGSLLFLPV